MLRPQGSGVASRREIKRILLPHFAGHAETGDEHLESAHGIEACTISARGTLEAISLHKSCERPVDFPEQHRGAGGCATTAGILAVDDHDIEALTRQSLCHQRAGDAGADDQRVTFDIFTDSRPRRLPGRSKPWRMPAAQVALRGGVGIENADDRPRDEEKLIATTAEMSSGSSVAQRAAVLARIGAAGQRALVPVDPDRLAAAERADNAGGLVAELLQPFHDRGRHAV